MSNLHCNISNGDRTNCQLNGGKITFCPSWVVAQVYQPIIYNAPHLGATEVSTDNGVSWHPAGPNVLGALSHSYQVTDVIVTHGLDTIHSRDLGNNWVALGTVDSSFFAKQRLYSLDQSDNAILKAVVSPNPTGGVTSVRFTRAASFDVELISPSGRQEWKSNGLHTNSNNELLFDLSGYSPGIYLIVFRDLQNDTRVVLKVAVKP